ncbi:MAG: hypothetical protein ABS81_09380 [Pseudonocardia sp. SCN 72-86]|nr:MAG: hypothetical protein ABS81_09380 [Pseudonocardia sp. SCN 72-86]
MTLLGDTGALVVLVFTFLLGWGAAAQMPAHPAFNFVNQNTERITSFERGVLAEVARRADYVGPATARFVVAHCARPVPSPRRRPGRPPRIG